MPKILIILIKMSIKHTDIKVKIGHFTLNVSSTSDNGFETR